MRNSDATNSKYLSIIVPVYNEQENIPLLHKRLREVLARELFSYEVIYIDDGSEDDTFNRLSYLVESDEHVRVIRFRRNFGQTAAMSAGFDHSSGDILVFMDGDLQNDPLDIPRLLAKLDEGYDVVSGWRKNRQDAQWSRKLPSQLANRLIARVTGVPLHDYGCTLKAYRREVFEHIRLYGEMHRFIPAYAALAGAEIAEIEVAHHARRFGKSKYGISRVIRVILDLMTIKFLGSFGTRPQHLFGAAGVTSLTLAAATFVYALGRNLLSSHSASSQRASVLPNALSFASFGLLSLMLGLLAELLTRTYYEAQQKPIYAVRQMLSQPLDQHHSLQHTNQHTLSAS